MYTARLRKVERLIDENLRHTVLDLGVQLCQEPESSCSMTTRLMHYVPKRGNGSHVLGTYRLLTVRSCVHFSNLLELYAQSSTNN